MFKHILIPTDGSRASARAGRAGVRLARTTGARVSGLFVAPPPTPLVYRRFVPVAYLPPDQHAEVIARTATRYLAVIAEAARAAGVRCQVLTVTSDFPADVILETAKRQKCDLIFMASHSRPVLLGALLGSQAQKVVTRSRIPVLLFRSGASA
jgi:nucleotide-binding universal stress UspA family protein